MHQLATSQTYMSNILNRLLVRSLQVPKIIKYLYSIYTVF
jgi:hypothetical protein